ncbi:MAG: MCE family protein [Saprospiraceae bacterium]|nr:MCE family protein [Saprospiraceae bacterium]
MANRSIDNLKLGAFVLSGLVLLVLFLYLLSKNQSIFSSRFEVKAHFEHVNGLVAGNNVRVSGIVVGIVEEVRLVNDTLVEVTLGIDEAMRTVLRKNALATIGTDGLIGNRVVNLLPAEAAAAFIDAGDVLQGQKEVSTEEMLRTLDQTNSNVLAISQGLIQTIERINNSTQLANLLNDESLSRDLKAALSNLRLATAAASGTMTDVQTIVGGIRAGEGSVGALLRDTGLLPELQQAMRKLQSVENQADHLAQRMAALVQEVDGAVQDVSADLNQGQGPAHLLLKDSLSAARLQNSLGNLEAGTARFNENMEALKHNVLFRRYFKKQARQKN